MKSYVAQCLSLVVLLVCPQVARAQEHPPVQLAPFAAFGTDYTAPIGLMVTFPLTGSLSCEAEISYRRGEGDVSFMSSSVSLLMDMPKVGRTTPYIAGGVGLSQYGTLITSESGASTGAVRRLALTFNAGGGLKAPITSGVDFRSDVRFFDALGTAPDSYRIANGVSVDVGRRK